MEVAGINLRTKLAHRLREWWRSASPTLRVFAVGGGAVAASLAILRVGGPDRVGIGLLLAGGLFLTAAFLLDLYQLALQAWNRPLGKVVGTLVATMVAAVSMALASVLAKDATGIDPQHLSYAVTFLAPLTAGFLLIAATMLIVVLVFVWFIVESVWAGLNSLFGQSKGPRPVGTDKVLIRLVGVIALVVTNAVLYDIGQRPYTGLLTGTAKYFTYGLEMYGNDVCALGGERIRRLNDEVVAVGRMTPTGVEFEQRRCTLADPAVVDVQQPPPQLAD